MAVNVVIEHRGLEGLGGGSGGSSDLSVRLDSLTKQVDALSKAVQSQSKSSDDLAKTIPAMNMAVLRAASDIQASMGGVSPESKDQSYYQRKATRVSSKYDTLESSGGSDVIPSSLKTHRDALKGFSDETGRLTNFSQQAKSSIESLSYGLSQLGKSASSAASGSLNAFNLAEVIGAAAISGGARYAGIGAAYGVNIETAPAYQLGQMTVNRDVAQRNTVASSIMGLVPAATMIGASIGPEGAAAGFIGAMALSIPTQILTNQLNAQQQQQLSMQQLGNQLALGGAGGVPTQVRPNASSLEMMWYGLKNLNHLTSSSRGIKSDYNLGYNVASPELAHYINSGQGYAASTEAAVDPAFKLYNSNRGGNLVSTISDLSQSTGVDLNSVGVMASYLAATSSGNFGKTFSDSIGAFGGINNLSTGYSNATNIAQLTGLTGTQALMGQEELAPFGNNAMNAGMSLQTMSAGSKLQMGALLGAFGGGINLRQVQNNPQLMQKVLQGGVNLGAGLPGMGGEEVSTNQLIFQNAMGVTNEQAIQNMKTGVDTNQHVSQDTSMPASVQTAINSLSKQMGSMNKTSNVQSITINASHVTLAGLVQGLDSKLRSNVSQIKNSLSGS